MAEFGENVWYLKSDSVGEDKLSNRWEEGVDLGARDETGESLVGTAAGVFKRRGSRRKATGKERWNKEKLDAMVGVPWQPTPGEESEEIKTRVNIPSEEGPITKPIVVEDKAPITRRVRIEKDEPKKFGYTVGCLGCRMAIEGRPAQSHSEECRARIMKRREEEQESSRGEKQKTKEEPSGSGLNGEEIKKSLEEEQKRENEEGWQPEEEGETEEIEEDQDEEEGREGSDGTVEEENDEEDEDEEMQPEEEMRTPLKGTWYRSL